MLVRYRLSSIPTLDQFKSDLNGIILGTITTTAQLSVPAQTYSSFLGDYPTGVYERVNETSFTYSKLHSTDNTKTHYFRLIFENNRLDAFALARSYTSGTDTLVDSTSWSTQIYTKIHDPVYAEGIDIVVSDKGIFVQAARCTLVSSGAYFGIFDIGHNGVTRRYSDSMLMAYVNLFGILQANIATTEQAPIFFTRTGVNVPYTYNAATFSYGTVSGGISTLIPIRENQSNNSTMILENPTYLSGIPSGSTPNLICGLYKLSQSLFGGAATYQDVDGLYRLSVQDFSIHVE